MTRDYGVIFYVGGAAILLLLSLLLGSVAGYAWLVLYLIFGYFAYVNKTYQVFFLGNLILCLPFYIIAPAQLFVLVFAVFLAAGMLVCVKKKNSQSVLLRHQAEGSDEHLDVTVGHSAAAKHKTAVTRKKQTKGKKAASKKRKSVNRNSSKSTKKKRK